MDTRDQTLTKLTRLHGKSHPTHHRPASLRWDYSHTAVSIMKLVMEDGWWWRWRCIPLSVAPTDSRSTLPRKIRAWRRLRIVKRDESFSPIFFLPESEYMELGLRSVESQGAHEAGGAPQGAPCTLVDRAWAPWCWFFRQYFSLIPKRVSVDFQVIPRTFISAQK